MTVEVHLRGARGGVALIDDSDAEMVLPIKWFCLQSRKNFYACQQAYAGNYRRMHRLIMQAPVGMLVDHINRNTLDNRRCNLRLCTHSENTAHSLVKIAASGYRGVRWVASEQRYIVRLKKDGRHYWGGSFVDVVEAARAHDVLARRLHGAFAILNLPSEAR
jgi:hypothetical protein